MEAGLLHLYSEANLPMDEFYRGYIKREYVNSQCMLKFELFKYWKHKLH